MIAAILQATVLNSVRVFNVKPDILLVIAAFLSLECDLRWALLLSVFAGVLKDALIGNPFGLNAFMFALWSLLIFRVSRKISIETRLARLLLILIVAGLNILVAKLRLSFTAETIPPGIFLRTAVLEVVYTVLVSPLVFRLISPLLFDRVSK
jgi:rod shape-determining protein MreD